MSKSHRPRRIRVRHGHWVNSVSMKLVLLGYEGSHEIVTWWDAGFAIRKDARLPTKRYYIERGNEGSESGYSPDACLLRMARRMEIV